MDSESSSFIAEGRAEAARANELRLRQARGASQVRHYYVPQIAAAPWSSKVRLWLQMRAEIRREKAKIEQEVAPREGIYLWGAGEERRLP